MRLGQVAAGPRRSACEAAPVPLATGRAAFGRRCPAFSRSRIVVWYWASWSRSRREWSSRWPNSSRASASCASARARDFFSCSMRHCTSSRWVLISRPLLGQFGQRGGLGLHPRGAGNGQQQRHQRPHRADQHRQEREQRNAGTVLLRASALGSPSSFHAAWAVRRTGSSLIGAAAWAVSASRALSMLTAAARLNTVCSKCFAPAKAARLRFSASSSRVTSPAAATARSSTSARCGQLARRGRHGRLHLFARLRRPFGPNAGRPSRPTPAIARPDAAAAPRCSGASSRPSAAWPRVGRRRRPAAAANRPANSCCTRRSTCSSSEFSPCST